MMKERRAKESFPSRKFRTLAKKRFTDLRRVYKIPTNTIFKMPRAPVYTGKIAFAGQVFDGKHEAIIDADLWDAVQDRIPHARTAPRPNACAYDYLLTGLVRCACGRAMTPTTISKANGQAYPYYRCTDSAVCPNRDYVKADELEAAVFILLPSSFILCNSGCVGMSEKKIAAAGKIADSYYNSANVAELWSVTSSNGTGKVTFENFNAFTMNTPVPPKNIIPREPSFWEGAWDTVKTLGPWAFFGYALGGGGLANHTSTTVNNAGTAAQ